MRRTTGPFPASVTRRSFLRAGAVAASGPLLAGLPASSRAAVPGANESLRLAWIGVGGRGTSLLGRALQSASRTGIRVTAICDIDRAARERAIERCGAMKPTGIHDYRDLLERDDVDAVFIATPVYLHAEHASAALRAGKHVYCEKPLGRTPEEVKVIVDAVEETGRKLQVGFQWRYHRGFLGLVDHVQGGGVGDVTFIDGARHVGGYPSSGWYADRNLSGDLIVEQAIHEMNVFCWMLDAEPVAAVGLGGTHALEDPGRSIMDAYAVTYEFPGRVRLNYSHLVYSAPGFGGLYTTVFGDRHRACELEGTVRLHLQEEDQKVTRDLHPEKDATEAAIESFVECIREDRRPLCDVEAGRRATLMAILGRTAIHERRLVEWSEVALES